MPKVCITTVIDGQYMDWKPLFEFCLKRAYPEYDYQIFWRGRGPFKGFPKMKYNTIAMRFVIPKEEFKGYDYVYITDIDMMIMREKPSLVDFHLDEMKQTRMCYSNSLRNPGHYAGNRSLTGLHFCAYEWFEKVEKLQRYYFDLLKRGLVGLYREYDGVMLYRMALNAGLGIPGKYPLTDRHHGIHMGNFRLFKSFKKFKNRIPKEFAQSWVNYRRAADFKMMYNKARENSVCQQLLDGLEKYCYKVVG